MKTSDNFSQDSQSVGLESKSRLPEYKAGLLFIILTHLVLFHNIWNTE
jgi:hypothetical protein